MGRPRSSDLLIALWAPRSNRTKEEPVREEMLKRQKREIAEVRTTGGRSQCPDPPCGAFPESVDAVGVENEWRAGMAR